VRGQSGNWLSYRDNLWGLIESEKFPNQMVEALGIIIDRGSKGRLRKRESLAIEKKMCCPLLN